MKRLLLAALCAALSACVTDDDAPSKHVFRVGMAGMTEPLAVRVSEGTWSELGFGLMASNSENEGISVFGNGLGGNNYSFRTKHDSSQVWKGNVSLASYAGMPCEFSKPEGYQALEGDSIPLVLRPVHFSHAMGRIHLGLVIDSAASEKNDARVDLTDRALVHLSMQVACP
jgi:hypothetical protein